MLLPRFTTRALLGIVTAASLVCATLMFAVQGQAWAIAVSMALALVAASFIAYAAVFLVTFLLAMVLRLLRRQTASDSPFATAAPPPQILPPQEPM